MIRVVRLRRAKKILQIGKTKKVPSTPKSVERCDHQVKPGDEAQKGVKGKESVKNSVLDAVTDSQEKYCGVSNMLKKALPVTWEINFNDVQIYTNKLIQATV